MYCSLKILAPKFWNKLSRKDL